MKLRSSIGLGVGLVVVIVLALATAAIAARTAARHGSSAAEQVRTAERMLLKAMVDGDTAKAGPLLAPDFQLIDVLGMSETRRDYLGDIGGGIDFVTVKPVSPIRVRLSGNTAAVRFEADFVVVAGPDRVEHHGWFTDMLEKHDDSWRLVWSQTGPTPNDPQLFIRSLKTP